MEGQSPSDWPDARLNALAQQVQEFRRECGEDHKGAIRLIERLESKMDKVAASVVEEAKSARASVRTVILSSGVPVFLALLGILYQLAFRA